jgi:hypothetical protein
MLLPLQAFQCFCASADPLAAPETIPSMVVGSAEALIAVNGWLGQREDFLDPFDTLPRRHGAHLFVLCMALHC